MATIRFGTESFRVTSKIKGFTEFNEARPYPERRPMSDSLRRAQANMKKLASGEVKKTTEKAKTWAQHKKDILFLEPELHFSHLKDAG